MKLLLLIGFILNLLASCVPATPIAPPDAALPPTYRGTASPAPSFADLPYQKLYADPVLQNLIATALKNNLSVESAYQTIQQAAANVDLNAGKQQIQVNGLIQAPYSTHVGNLPSVTYNATNSAKTTFLPNIGVGASYEFDFFGKLSSATRAARAQLLQSIAARDAVMWQLVANVAANYFTLREQDAALTLARSTLTARKSNLDLVNARFQGGVANLLDVRQAEESYYEVAGSIPEVQRAIALTEDTLSTLVGSYPKEIPRGLDLEKQVDLPAVPPTGIPSQLLTRRPDIIQAEDSLAAASANVDVARALLYPQITLGATAAGGGLALDGVFYGPAGLFSIAPQLLAPLFNGGSLKANVRLTQAQREQIAVSYLSTVQKAMQEVADSVASYDRLREYSTQADLKTAAAVDSLRLANLRYRGGVSSYLEVLDSETRSYQDQVASVEAHLNERLALVQLYLALGGGWQGTSTGS